MGGKKHKIKIEEITKKIAKTVAFTKRRNGLFRKASELCRLSHGTQIAVIMTPVSTKSHASFYSFGHSSVDHVVSSLLHDHSPSLRTNQGFWWEDEDFDRSENVEELKEAVDALSRMLNNVRLRLDDAVKSNQRDGGLGFHYQEEEEVLQLRNNEETMNQIPIFQGETSGSASNLLENYEEDNLHLDIFFSDFDIGPLI